MKKLFLLLATSAMLFSCTPLYRQVATIHSDNVALLDNGKYATNLDEISINYDFWSENGDVVFEIHNNSEKDIFIDMSKSFFIKNGIANDYFRNSSSIISYNTNVSKAFGTMGTNTTLKSKLSTATTSSGVSTSIEYAEKSIICIPSKSYKVIAQFTLTDAPYRECGFIRDPIGKEVSIFTFNENNSPLIFENRLMFIIDSKETLLTNKFYVCQMQNINDKKCFVSSGRSGCNENGITIYSDIFSSPNKYYVHYTRPYPDEDRIASPTNSKSNKARSTNSSKLTKK